MDAGKIKELLEKHSVKIHDEMGWTGEFKIEVKDMVDMFIENRKTILGLFGVSKSHGNNSNK